MKTLDVSQARAAVEIGGILAANIRPHGSRFYVEFETRQGPAVLVATNTRKPRAFSPLKAFEAVRELGLDGGRYTLASWRPDEAEVDKPRRPDRAQAMKRVHEAAAYDKWFRGQVKASMEDERPNVPHDQVMEQVQALIDGAAHAGEG